MTNNKIPIGKYKCIKNSSGEEFNYIQVKFKDGVKVEYEDIITLDMIEPYESEAVRKVETYLSEFMSLKRPNNDDYLKRHAKEIVALVHEAEDADE